MECVCSGASIWVDFSKFDALALPFKLSYTYLMNEDAISDDKLSPAGLVNELVMLGLVKVAWTEDEFYIAEDLSLKYNKLSLYDRVAIAIAKYRHIVLLTNEPTTIEAAAEERVPVKGTIDILDELFISKKIDYGKYRQCLVILLSMNGQEVILPENELISRLEKVSNVANTPSEEDSY